jgi:hypothetical protein
MFLLYYERRWRGAVIHRAIVGVIFLVIRARLAIVIAE